MAKKTFYFSHDYSARSDQKIKMMVAELGMRGYGIYWAIIEDLYQNANALRTHYDSIAYDLREDVHTIERIIEGFDLFVLSDGFFSSKSVERRLSQVNEKSVKARESALKRWGSKSDECERIADAMQTQCDSNANKVNNNIYNNININKSIVGTSKKEVPTPQLLKDVKIEDLKSTSEKITKAFFDRIRINRQELGVKNFSKFDQTKVEDWDIHVKRLLEIDKAEISDIRNVLIWLSTDNLKNSEFWKKNIQSTQKLRQQYDKLLIAMNEDVKNKKTEKNKINTKTNLGL